MHAERCAHGHAAPKRHDDELRITLQLHATMQKKRRDNGQRRPVHSYHE
jgi:hypothetical protein